MPFSGWVLVALPVVLAALVVARLLWSRRTRSLVVPFHLDLTCNPQQVVEAVTTAVRSSAIDGVADDPAPHCLVVELSPFFVMFGVLLWMDANADERIVRSEILLRVHLALERLRGSLPASHESTIAKFTRILRAIPIFANLPEEALNRLAPSLSDAKFSRGDFIVRQGGESGSMYVIIDGTVEVLVDAEGKSKFVARLDAGQFFGELSVFTGEPRTANVVAISPVECLVIDKDSLMSLFDWRPELAEEIAQVITRRQAGLAAMVELPQGEGGSQTLERIQRYFGLS